MTLGRLAPAALRVCVVVAVVSLALAARAPEAFALCPNCLAQTRTLTPTLQLLGAFLFLPFVVAYLVYRAIRRACRDPG